MISFVKEWIYRLRHNRGFGVQSPVAFHFVMHVLREHKHPYYCYPALNQMAREAGDYPAEHCRRLFRICNYVKPRNIVAFADTKGNALTALSAGYSKVPSCAVDNIDELIKYINNFGYIGLLHIGRTPHYEQVLKEAIANVDNRSVIIVEGIHRNKRIRRWWKSIVAHPRVVISMDIYSAGILFFDTEYKKQHYTFWFK